MASSSSSGGKGGKGRASPAALHSDEEDILSKVFKDTGRKRKIRDKDLDHLFPKSPRPFRGGDSD